MSGATGATGATGVNGIQAENAPWHNLNLGMMGRFDPEEDDSFPSCFPDNDGKVYMRGHLNFGPVPFRGGGLLAMLPFTNTTEKKCGCTPEGQDVIVTTTAVAYATPGDATLPDICVLRVLIDNFVPVDVNRDFYINQTDIDDVRNSGYYVPSNTGGPCTDAACQKFDVNRDGRIIFKQSLANKSPHNSSSRFL